MCFGASPKSLGSAHPKFPNVSTLMAQPPALGSALVLDVLGGT